MYKFQDTGSWTHLILILIIVELVCERPRQLHTINQCAISSTCVLLRDNQRERGP